jgi:hypothetical protein
LAIHVTKAGLDRQQTIRQNVTMVYKGG